MKFFPTLITLILIISPPVLAEDINEQALQWLNSKVKPEQAICPERQECICIKYSAPARYALARYCPLESKSESSEKAYEVITWDKAGKKVDEGFWLNGKPDGVWKSWYPNGVQAAESFSENGYEEGKFTTWYDNGAVSVVGYHKHGENNGTWIYKDRNGKTIKKFEWDNGKLVSKKEFE